MRKVWAIAQKDIYGTFTSRGLLAIMFAMPLALATIISLAFGGAGGGSTGIAGIPVAIVNLDTGDPASGFNGGAAFVSAFVPAPADAAASPTGGGCPADAAASAESSGGLSLFDLTNAVTLADADAARAGVDDGTYTAAVIIPADFSSSLAYSQTQRVIAPVPVEVYGSAGRPITAGIVRSIVEGIANQLVVGYVAIASTFETALDRAPSALAGGLQAAALGSSASAQTAFACGFSPSYNTIAIDQRSVTEGDDTEFNILVSIGSAQAVFFALFTASAAAASILEEKRDGTLQRILVTPTTRITFMLGKLLGTYAQVLLQIVFLFIGFTFINSLLKGQFSLLWGDNWPLLILLVLTTALGAAGVGMIAAAVGRTSEQGQIIGSIIALMMGVLGGAFFNLAALGSLEFFTRLSIVRWGSEGFARLAAGQTDVLPNIVVLGLLGAVFFAISLFAFYRRQDI